MVCGNHPSTISAQKLAAQCYSFMVCGDEADHNTYLLRESAWLKATRRDFLLCSSAQLIVSSAWSVVMRQNTHTPAVHILQAGSCMLAICAEQFLAADAADTVGAYFAVMKGKPTLLAASFPCCGIEVNAWRFGFASANRERIMSFGRGTPWHCR